MLSGYWFSQGHLGAYVVGALLYFAAVLVDLKSMAWPAPPSRISLWLLAGIVCDYATYVLFAEQRWV
jgi:hypothetical protein